MKPQNDFHKDVQILSGNGDNVDPIGVLPLRYEYLEGGPVLVSCWRVSWRDILRIIWHQRLWLVVMGDKWPPLFIESDKKYTGIKEWDENGAG